MSTNDGASDSDLTELRRRLDAMDDLALPDHLDPRWDAYAAGLLSAEEQAELLRATEGDPELEKAAALFAPLDERLRHHVASSASAQFHRGNDHDSVHSLEPRRIVVKPPTRLARRGLLAGLMATAAASLVWVVTDRRAPPQGSALPAYEAAWRSGEQSVRGQTNLARPTFVTGSAIVVWIRPRTATSAEPRFIAAIDTWDRAAHLSVQPDRSASGALRLRGVLGEPPWRFDPGPHRLLVAVGPPDAEPPEGAPERPWQTFELRFEVR